MTATLPLAKCDKERGGKQCDGFQAISENAGAG